MSAVGIYSSQAYVANGLIHTLDSKLSLNKIQIHNIDKTPNNEKIIASGGINDKGFVKNSIIQYLPEE